MKKERQAVKTVLLEAIKTVSANPTANSVSLESIRTATGKLLASLALLIRKRRDTTMYTPVQAIVTM